MNAEGRLTCAEKRVDVRPKKRPIQVFAGDA
jgi:hypothetical protein